MVEDAEIIATYERLESCRKVADALGIKSQESVRLVLVKNGIKRTHRHDHEHQRLCNCNGRASHCAALVVMLQTVGNLRCCEIADITGYCSSSIDKIIARCSLGDRRRKRDIDETILDVIEAEYLSGASTYELGVKYGVHHGTITKWMKKRGHYRGRGYVSEKRLEENAARRERKREQKSKEQAERKKQRDELLGRQREQREAEQRAKQEQKRIEKETEYKKEKTCALCGSVFHSECRTKLYCSSICKKRARYKQLSNSAHRKRARAYGVDYESGITLQKLIERDGNICQICGKPCDDSDLRWGFSGPNHPTIDHIKPMSKGGPHTWDNVQLAHAICNSYKRDLWEVSA